MTIPYQTVSAPAEMNAETGALRAEVSEALRKNNGRVSSTIEALIAKYAEANQEEFYPLVARLFQMLGFDCQLSRRGRNYERADATIVANDGSVPIEIKSPGEEMEISVKGVRQALENKVVLLARKRFPVKRDDTSLVVGYEPPNDRSEVHELVDDIEKAFNLRVGVVDFRSLLTLVVEVVASGKQVRLTSFKQLKGVIRVERSSPA